MTISALSEIDKDLEIHTDILTHEFGDPRVKRLLWGNKYKKPSAQMDFDRLVIKACRQIAKADDKGDHDYRPRVKDLNSGRYFLLDTGAALSVFPHSGVQSDVDDGGGLQAINGSKSLSRL